MKLDEYMGMMDEDAVIDQTDLTRESLRIPQLAAKYNRYLMAESKILKQAEVLLAEKETELYKYYIGEGTDAIYKRMPLNKKPLKSEIPMYIKSNSEYTELSTKVYNQRIKVDLIVDFIKQLNSRTYLIKNAIDWEKFKNGVN